MRFGIERGIEEFCKFRVGRSLRIREGSPNFSAKGPHQLLISR